MQRGFGKFLWFGLGLLGVLGSSAFASGKGRCGPKSDGVEFKKFPREMMCWAGPFSYNPPGNKGLTPEEYQLEAMKYCSRLNARLPKRMEVATLLFRKTILPASTCRQQSANYVNQEADYGLSTEASRSRTVLCVRDLED